MNADLNDVALLVRVVQTHSFSAAARERGVPVSTVSRRIARLESALDTRLLERTTRALRLTDAGRAYFEHASRAMDDIAQAAERLRERQIEPSGRVRILAPTWFADAVSSVLFDWLSKHPRVSVDLELGQQSFDSVAAGFDIAIVAGKIEETPDFVAREIWRASPKLLVASPRYVRARGAPRGVADLARHDLLSTRSSDGFATWTLLNGRMRRRCTFAPRLQTSEIAVAQRAALQGLGIALLPESLCTRDLTKKRLVRVLDGWEGERGGVHLLFRAHRSLTTAVRGCIDHLLATLPGAAPPLVDVSGATKGSTTRRTRSIRSASS